MGVPATATEAAPEIMAPPTVSGYSRHVCSPAKPTRRLTGSASWSYVFPLAPTGMNEYEPAKVQRLQRWVNGFNLTEGAMQG